MTPAMPPDCAPASASRAVELGRFLRTRRERLHPGQVGVVHAGPRRVPGLRREEAALIAGLSLSYYTRIEQGQVGPPSDSVLTSLARAFGLRRDEVDYVRCLAAGRDTRPSGAAARHRGASDGPARLVDAMATPAVVVDHVLDILAWNDAACGLFDPEDTVVQAGVGPNVARLVLLDSATRRLLADPDEVAAVIVGHLRLRLAHHPDDPALRCLLGELADDDGFRTLWARHDVHDLGPGSLRLHLPGRGAVRMRVDALRRPQSPDETLLTLLPAVETTARAA